MVDYHQVLEAIKNQSQIIDARPSNRFNGITPEPRKGAHYDRSLPLNPEKEFIQVECLDQSVFRLIE